MKADRRNPMPRPRRPFARWKIVGLSAVGSAMAVAAITVAVLATTTAASSAASPYAASKLARIDAAGNQLTIEQSHAGLQKPSYGAGLKQAQAAEKKMQAAGTSSAPREAGFIQMHQGPFSAGVFTVKDFYQGPARKSWLLVYAGSTATKTGAEPDKGAVTVYAEPAPGGAMTFLGTFIAPGNSTSVTATRASGSDLTLRTEKGQVLTFNLSSLAYTN